MSVNILEDILYNVYKDIINHCCSTHLLQDLVDENPKLMLIELPQLLLIILDKQ
jgi:hypothetical protein